MNKPDAKGNVSFHVTQTKSRDKYHGYPFVVVARHVPFVQHYVQHIRRDFVDRFGTRKGETDRDRAQRVCGLFLGPNGRRYDAFDALPLLSSVVTNVRITVTTLRKLVATYAAQHYTTE